MASELKSEPEERNISVEQFALEVLGQAVHKQEWLVTNQRRLALIRRQFANRLTPAEMTELQELQQQAEQQLEALDAVMLNDVSQMEQAVTDDIDG